MRAKLLCVVVGLFVAWSGGLAVAQEMPRSGGTLVILTESPPLKFDPHLMHFVATYVISSQVFQGLTAIDPVTGEIVPELCESWEVSGDGTVYTFYLRKGVKFHHGREMTAEDVKFSLDRIRDPTTGSTWQALHSAVDSVEILDRYTIRINLKYPFPPLLEVLTWRGGAIVPKDVVEEYGNLNVHVIGTGPFMFKEYQEGIYVRLVKNPVYFKKGLPYLDEVIFRIIPEPTTRMIEMLRGRGHVLIEPSVDLLYPLEAAGFKVHVEPSAATAYISFQLGRGGHPMGPTADLRVRKAFAMAIDKKEIADAATFGLGFPINHIVPVGSGWELEVPAYERDLEEAKRLLAEAGYEDGVEIVALWATPGPYYERAITQMAEQVREVGITIKMAPCEFGTYVERRAAGEFGFFMTATLEGLDPYFRSQIYFLSEELGGSFNKNHYSNPRVDELLLQAMRETDKNVRKELYTQVYTIVFYEDVIWIPMFSYPRIWVESPDLHDFFYTILSIPVLERAWLSK